MTKPRQLWLVLAMVIFVIGLVAGGRYLIHQRSDQKISVIVPKLSPAAKAGEAVFVANCAVCHGMNAGGSDKGPPLVDPIYRPSHHGDFSFVRAVTLGVPQHHWLFGAMPAQPQVSEQQIDQIVAYIREVQIANGID